LPNYSHVVTENEASPLLFLMRSRAYRAIIIFATQPTKEQHTSVIAYWDSTQTLPSLPALMHLAFS